jgi:hypothetical protein
MVDDELVQLSADLFELNGAEWNGYGAALNLAAPKQSDAMFASEPFGLLPPPTLSDNGVLYQGGTNSVSFQSCTDNRHLQGLAVQSRPERRPRSHSDLVRG